MSTNHLFSFWILQVGAVCLRCFEVSQTRPALCDTRSSVASQPMELIWSSLRPLTWSLPWAMGHRGSIVHPSDVRALRNRPCTYRSSVWIISSPGNC